MGLVYADITLRNFLDEDDVRRGIIKESEIRQTTVKAMVDTGAMRLIINEEIRQLLGLQIRCTRKARLADGTLNEYDLTEQVIVQWKNRESICQPMVLPNSTNVLLGVIPLEEMDLIVDPVSQELVGANGDEIVYRI